MVTGDSDIPREFNAQFYITKINGIEITSIESLREDFRTGISKPKGESYHDTKDKYKFMKNKVRRQN